MTDRHWEGANPLDKPLTVTMLLQKLLSVDRWLQLLQLFEEFEILSPDLVICALGAFNVQRFAINDEVRSGIRAINRV